MDKIFLSGPSGVGKTTFVNTFCENNKDYNKVVNILTTISTNKLITFLDRQNLMINNLIELHNSSKNYICDRSILDVIMWTMAGNGLYSYKTFYNTLSRIKSFNDTIYIIITTPPNFKSFKPILESILSEPKRYKAYQEILKTDGDIGRKIYDHTLTTEALLREFINRWNEERVDNRLRTLYTDHSEDCYGWQGKVLSELSKL